MMHYDALCISVDVLIKAEIRQPSDYTWQTLRAYSSHLLDLPEILSAVKNAAILF